MKSSNIKRETSGSSRISAKRSSPDKLSKQPTIPDPQNTYRTPRSSRSTALANSVAPKSSGAEETRAQSPARRSVSTPARRGKS